MTTKRTTRTTKGTAHQDAAQLRMQLRMWLNAYAAALTGYVAAHGWGGLATDPRAQARVQARVRMALRMIPLGIPLRRRASVSAMDTLFSALRGLFEAVRRDVVRDALPPALATPENRIGALVRRTAATAVLLALTIDWRSR